MTDAIRSDSTVESAESSGTKRLTPVRWVPASQPASVFSSVTGAVRPQYFSIAMMKIPWPRPLIEMKGLFGRMVP